MKTKLTWIAIASLYFFSCSSDKIKERGVLLKAEDEIVFKLDEDSNYKGTMMSYWENEKGDAYFVNENRYKNSLQFYSMSSGKLLKEIILEYSGETGMSQIRGYHIHNLDSIYLSSENSYTLFLINEKARILKKWPLRLDEAPFEFVSITRSPIHFDKERNTVYGYKMPTFKLGRNIAGEDLGIQLDLDTGKAEIIQDYPSDYTGFYSTFHIAASVVKEGDRVIYSIPITDKIYIRSLKDKSTKVVNAPSKYVKDYPKPVGVNNFKKDMDYAIKNTVFNEIVYDEYRKVFYRFIALPIALIDDSTGQKLTKYEQKPFSVQVLDMNLNLLGETRFEENKYYSKDFFVGRDGLYISNANDFNPNFQSDNELSFTKFVLE